MTNYYIYPTTINDVKKQIIQNVMEISLENYFQLPDLVKKELEKIEIHLGKVSRNIFTLATKNFKTINDLKKYLYENKCIIHGDYGIEYSLEQFLMIIKDSKIEFCDGEFF